MKRIIVALLFCGASLQVLGAGTRNLIVPIDWGKEHFEREFNKSQFQLQSEEFGATTQTLMMALIEKAAPIIVSSATWGNLVARAAFFRDAIQNRDMSYLQKYPVFANPQNISAFKAMLVNGYDPNTDLMYQRAPNNGQLYYYFAYQLFFSKNPAFKPNEWISKKLSDYVYLLIPVSYIQELQARKDTPMDNQIEYEVDKKQDFQSTTLLSLYERLVGMKFEKFLDIPVSTLLDMFAHPTRMNYNNYQNLVRPNAFSMVQTLLQFKWEEILKGYLFGQHLVFILPQLFVTHADLTFPGESKDKTDVNEAYFLQEWLVYFDGHGSPSQPTPVLPVVYDVGGGGIRAEIAFTAGIEQGAFREVLGFLNNQVNTGSLLYVSCYSGGPHLFKLFEHNWDYPVTKGARVGKGKQAPKEVHIVPDVFNYLIIATNQFYTTTYSPTVGFWFDNPNYWPRLPGRSPHIKGGQKPNGLEFNNYFRSMAQLLHPTPIPVGTKNGSKKQKVMGIPTLKQDLIKTISYVHQFDFAKNYMIPAIRLPYTEWFVSLVDLGGVLRLESEQAWQERERQKAQVRSMLEAKLKKQVVPQKVQESIKQYEAASPDAQEKARLEKERLEKEEKDRKEKELFERIEKFRKEKEEREKAKQKPEPSFGKPPVTQPTPKQPAGGAPQPVKPQPVPPVTPSIKPQVPLQPIDINKLPPPVVIPPGTKPPTLPSTLPPPPKIPFPGQSPLSQALVNLENALKALSVRLR